MTVQQKVAWFNLAVLAAAAVTYVALVPALGAQPALGSFGICGLWGLGFLFYRRRANQVLLDERDRLVSLRAQIAGLWIFWELFVAACMITWAALRFWRNQNTVSVDVLPLLVGGGMVVFTLSHSVAILIQYGRSEGHESREA